VRRRLVHELDLAVGFDCLHEGVGDAHGDVEVGEVALVLRVDELLDVRVVAAQHAQSAPPRRLPADSTVSQERSNTPHIRHRAGGARMRALHVRSLGTDRGKVVATPPPRRILCRRYPHGATFSTLFRAAGGRFDLQVVDVAARLSTRSRSRRAMRRGGRRLRLFLDPSQGSGREGHAFARLRPGVVYASVRPLLRDGGVRRQPPRAQMGVLRCGPPDVEEFIHAKDEGDLANFNISVGVTDAFMQAVEATARSSSCTRRRARRSTRGGLLSAGDGLWVYRKLSARALWDQIMRSTYDHAEPGILFIDRMNRDKQPQLLRSDRGDQPVRRATASAVRLLLPGLDQPRALS